MPATSKEVSEIRDSLKQINELINDREIGLPVIAEKIIHLATPKDVEEEVTKQITTHKEIYHKPAKRVDWANIIKLTGVSIGAAATTFGAMWGLG